MALSPCGAEIAVRRLVAADIPAVAAMLVRAFVEDPTTEWLFPGASRRISTLLRWFVLNTELVLGTGEGWVTEDLAAASLWLPVGPVPDRPPRNAGAWTLVRIHLQLAAILGTRLPTAAMGTARAVRLHPREPGWFLAVLGTEPARQRQGLGSAVMAPVLERCRRTGVGAVLDTATLEDVRFYQRLGFAVVGEVSGTSAPPLWVMRLAPEG
jgi:GNAT superfamily N-acetyltransferase